MKKCYIKVVNGNVICSLGTSKKVPNGCIEISQEQYEKYKTTISSIPSKSGYTKKVTLYLDGTYDVEYTEIIEVEDSEE